MHRLTSTALRSSTAASALLPLTVFAALAACGPIEEFTDSGPPDTASQADAAPPWDAFIWADTGTPVIGPPYQWVIVHDDTHSEVGMSEYFGTDVDGLSWTCPDGTSGSGVEVVAKLQGGATERSADAALGAPDGPCANDLGACAVTLGPLGWVALKADARTLDGCEIQIHEQADMAVERFVVYVCTAPELAVDACGRQPIASGTDGQTVTVTFKK